MKNLVLITSVINTPAKPLSYISKRSVYTTLERFEQTKKTFETVKEKIPDSRIFLVECSELNDEQSEYFKTNSDFFLNLYNNEYVRDCSHGISKSLGEGTMTLYALENILSNNIEFEHLIKVSGRYWLSDEFNYEHFNNHHIVVKYIYNDPHNVFTALYQLPKDIVRNFHEFLKNNTDKMIQCIGYEILFGIFLMSLGHRLMSENTDIKNIDHIGLTGFVSVSDKNQLYIG